MSRIDIVIPCYKYGHYLRRCVESVLNEPVNVRALIIDDCSPDNTEEVGRQLAKEDPRVEFRRHPVNLGHTPTWNEGMEWATGDYRLALSSDDLLTPGALRRAVGLLDAHPDMTLCYGGQIFFQTNEQLPDLPPNLSEGYRVLSSGQFLEACCKTGQNIVPTPTAIIRTHVVRGLRAYREELPYAGDLEMWMRYGAHGSVGALEADQCWKRMHGQNIQYVWQRDLFQDVDQRRLAFETLFREHGDRIADRERLERMARRALAEDAFWRASKTFDQGDDAGCRKLLELAAGLDPEIQSRSHWARLRWKRRLGPKLWSLLQPQVDRVRRWARTAPGAA